ncbi:hypothetical protein NUSPORA_00817 [Nucleospora cyclopteri]
MFLFSLNAGLILGAIDKDIQPGENYLFIEKLDENDESFKLSITNMNKTPGLRCSIKEPSKRQIQPESSEFLSENSSIDETGHTVDENPFKKIYSRKGTYLIQLTNTGSGLINVSINTFVYKKVQESQQGISTLRNTLQSLNTAMDNLRAENYYLNSHHLKNIREAESIRKMQNLLVLFPILTIVIGYCKHAMARHMVKPRKKKFKKVFTGE